MPRAVRRFFKVASCVQEIGSMKEVRSCILDRLQDLNAHLLSKCEVCNADLRCQLHGVLCVLDQALEARSSGAQGDWFTF